ncbi:MAG: ZIP family metal transporter [Cyclobacteriaceae bacterium]|jgi:ZIP family zinc transporter|nr:ZIP family metal transporter [Cyclobacteriaceae bacterium]
METWLTELGPVMAALLATIFTWLLTALGAALVFLVNRPSRRLFDVLLGFAGGVMVAASFWSLLSPSITLSERLYPDWAWMPAAVGFGLGGLFLFGLDKLMPHLHINFGQEEKEGVPTSLHSTSLLVLAITLHNIPEGLAVGVMFGAAASGIEEASIGAAIALAIGIGLQNFPEGLAVSFPVRALGASRLKSFWYGQLSATVEPVAGVLGAYAVMQVQGFLPFALAFAAGAMIYVVIEEVIPETQRSNNTDLAVLGFIFGFIVMMVLDVALG